MTANALNEFMKLVFKNKEVIYNVYFFDEVDDYHVQGVEIRLKEYDSKIDYTDVDANCLRPDPFRSNISGYSYIILGYESNYQRWLKIMIEGNVAKKLIRKYPEILSGNVTPELREQINRDEVIFKQEIENSLVNR